MSWFRSNEFHSEHESAAEVELLKAFHFAYARGELKEKPLTNHQVLLKDGLVEFETHPDFWFMQSEIALFLDGEYHLGVQGKRDERIDLLLGARKIKVLRFPYKPPISQRLIGEILESVRQSLK